MSSQLVYLRTLSQVSYIVYLCIYLSINVLIIYVCIYLSIYQCTHHLCIYLSIYQCTHHLSLGVHRGLVHIKTNFDHLILPIEIHILTHLVYPLQEHFDFGTAVMQI